MDKHKFRFKKGDRVDFLGFEAGDVNGTPGTVTSRIHTREFPAYRVAWDDGYTDGEPLPGAPEPDVWWERDLVPEGGESTDV